MTEREFPVRPMVGVGAVVVDSAGRILLVRRGTEPLKGHWSLPGGLIELGETLLDAVRREVAEETGLEVEPIVIAEVVDRIHRHESDTGAKPTFRYHYVIVDYLCRILNGNAQAASDAAEVCWATRSQWRDSNFYSLDELARQVIEKGWQMAAAAGIHGEEEAVP